MTNIQNKPRHIGIIMDGNGRWAQQRGVDRREGHKAGVKTMQNIVRHCFSRGVQCITVYAFSTENWQRPKEEVEGLFGLIKNYLKHTIGNKSKIKKENICIEFIGDLQEFDSEIIRHIKRVRLESSDCDGGTLNIAINYGGRQEIVNAINSLNLLENELTIETFETLLYTKNSPPLDMIIRTGGEKRLSNFMLYQAAYSELFFVDTLWPDFDVTECDSLIAEFASRKRNFGNID